MKILKTPPSIIALGLVSFFMDVSSESIHSLLPVFLVSVLSANAFDVGLIEGLALAAAAISKVLSGAFSDWVGRRKPLVFAGYAVAALTKPAFPLAQGIGVIFAARIIDRIGKGIRDAPRDALVADLASGNQRGAAYGLRIALDAAGAFIGPMLALILMVVTGGNFRAVFWVAVLPALIAVALVAFAVHEPSTSRLSQKGSFPIRKQEIKRLGDVYWRVTSFAAFLTLARFSQAFLILRAQNVGLAENYVPLVWVVINVVYAVGAYPFGYFSDQISRRLLLTIGTGFLIIADLILAYSTNPAMALIGAAIWGMHLAATEGLLASIVADTAPANLMGTAFGVFNLITGCVLLLANVLAGYLWAETRPAIAFLVAAGVSAFAVVGLLVAHGQDEKRSEEG